MWHTETADVSCPYCGESIEVVVDPSEDAQSYIEDCSVSCRPMESADRTPLLSAP